VSEPLPVVLVPGLLSSARLYGPQIPYLWREGAVTIADHTRDESMGAIAQRILAAAPPRFALVGLSMGGYISFEILRQAPDRVARLALLDTSARPDTAEASAGRRAQMELASAGRLSEVADAQFARMVAPERRADGTLRDLNRLMTEEVGPQAFVRQQRAIMGRADSRATLALIRCPTLVLVGEADELTPAPLAAEIAGGISGARLVRVPGCGHLSTLEKPDQVTPALLQWLRA
jgi:pimeloyl-ACP methyl ester carboxylesterase